MIRAAQAQTIQDSRCDESETIFNRRAKNSSQITELALQHGLHSLRFRQLARLAFERGLVYTRSKLPSASVNQSLRVEVEVLECL